MQSAYRHHQGFTLIELLIVITVIGILASMAIPNLVTNRKTANECSAVNSLRMIDQAETAYRTRNGSYGSLDSLATAGLVDPALSGATGAGSPKSGYYFVVQGTTSSQYFVTALPITAGGDRQFYTDESGLFFMGSLAPAPPTPTTDTDGTAPAGFTPLNN